MIGYSKRKKNKATAVFVKIKVFSDQVFNSTAKPVLMYGSETWLLTKVNTKKLQIYAYEIWWPNKISNDHLWKKTKQENINTEKNMDV